VYGKACSPSPSEPWEDATPSFHQPRRQFREQIRSDPWSTMLMPSSSPPPPQGVQVDAVSKQHASLSGPRTPSPDLSMPWPGGSNTIQTGFVGNSEHAPFAHGRAQASQVPPAQPPAAARTWRAKLQSFWVANKGLALVLIGKFFGALMNATIRLLEIDGNDGMLHVSQTGASINLTCLL